MKESLQSIAKVPGVQAVFLYGAKNEVLASAETSTRPSAQIQPVLREVGLTLTTAAIYGEGIDQLDFFLRHRYIFARRLVGSWLIAICDEHVDVAMLRMAMNVAMAELREQEGIYRFLSHKTKWIEMDGKSLAEIHHLLNEKV